MIEKIRFYGDEVLRKKAKTIEIIDKNIKEKVNNLIETLESRDEFALAAPQVGYSLRMFIMRNLWEEDPKKVKTMLFINPELLEFDGMLHEPEGCLSFPGIFEKVKRAKSIKFKAQDINGKWKHYTAEDLFARGVQHEYDHLEGILFIDKINPLKRKLLHGKLKKIAETTKNGVNIG
ncbi:MAG: peptide deformylase [Candidatus Cloacimonadota bacterium]|nr:peptide deformylase [Candidatus Cloacimonadota bacterium]